MPVIRSIGPVSGGKELISPAVYGCRGAVPQLCRGRFLDDLARVHDRDPVGDLEEQ